MNIAAWYHEKERSSTEENRNMSLVINNMTRFSVIISCFLTVTEEENKKSVFGVYWNLSIKHLEFTVS